MTTPALKLDPHNANRGTDRGRRAVADSLAECGAGRSILVDRDGTVIAGNKTLEAAQALGLPVRVVESSGDELVVVQRTDLELDGEDQRARRLAYLDNRAAQLGLDWDTDQILADLNAGVDFSGLWDDAELDELLKRVSGTEGLTDPDDVPEVPEEATTQRGDLWLLGRHRLLCGDSTNVTDVDRLMDGAKADMVFTDPPYGIDVVRSTDGGAKAFGTADSGGSNIVQANQYAPIIGDDTTDTARDVYNLCVGLGMTKQVIWGGNYFTDFLLPARCWFVWDKKGREWDDNFSDFEMAWTSFDKPSKIFRHTWMGIVQEGEREKRVHPTQKPVKLIVDILDYLEAGLLIADFFGGSGSTLLACEQTGRNARLMELSPAYCDVIVRRWEEFTGRKAVLDGNEGHTQSS